MRKRTAAQKLHSPLSDLHWCGINFNACCKNAQLKNILSGKICTMLRNKFFIWQEKKLSPSFRVRRHQLCQVGNASSHLNTELKEHLPETACELCKVLKGYLLNQMRHNHFTVKQGNFIHTHRITLNTDKRDEVLQPQDGVEE